MTPPPNSQSEGQISWDSPVAERSNRSFSAFLDFILARPTEMFWLFAVTHLFLWTLIPTLANPGVPLDVIEGYAWGHEWLLGTYKHPPMQAWWLEIMATVTGRASWAHYFVSQIAVVTAFWAVWKMGMRILGPREALISVLLLEGVIYYNFTSPEFNPNVLQLPFWALIGLFFHRAIKDNRTTDWLLLGLWSAGGLYTKYSTVLLLAVLVVLTLLHPEGRQRLKQKGPYIAVGFAALLFLPHVLWLFKNDFLPVQYVVDRIENPATDKRHLAQPLQFLMSQILAILPMLALLLLLAPKNIMMRAKPAVGSFDRHFLWTMAFGPLLILLLVSSLGVKVRDMWGTPFWGYTSLWIMSRSQVVLTPSRLRRFTYGWSTMCVLLLTAYGLMNTVFPYLTHKVQRVHFPGQAIAQEVADGWHAKMGAPLKYIVGDTWISGNIAYFMPERPHVFIRGDYNISPWIPADEIKKNGAVIVWCKANCASHDFPEAEPEFLGKYPSAIRQEPITAKRLTGADVKPVSIGWAILPPVSGAEAEAN